MTEANRQINERWALKRAVLLSAVCLVVGMTAGWVIRGPVNPQISASAKDAPVPAMNARAGGAPAPTADPARLKAAADAEAVPLLAQLKSKPDNPELLANVGNLYYDAQQYPIAIDYYGRALKAKPADAFVRTDMATAYWYMGNTDTAIAEFNQALTYAPNNPNTLFNLGLVKWQGKMDAAGAIHDWNTLLATNPNYEAKEKVERMLTEVEKQQAASLKSN